MIIIKTTKKKSSLNELIHVKYRNSNTGVNFDICPISLREYLSVVSVCGDKFYLTFSEPPDSIRLHTFSIYYQETNGTVYTDTLNSVYLTP